MSVFWSTVSQGMDDGLTAIVVAAPDGGEVTIKLCGSIDRQSCAIVSETFLGALADHAAERIVLDVAGVDFCDVAGVRVLVAAHRHAAACGVTCSIVNPREHIRWLFGAMGTAAVLEVAGG
ncbi:STAS domain-containing protein [Actinoplanes sp. NPDC049316]|uniref:STAS domain-containing protein n=1 Tax=Actinoplanes sp. NPDC049316 TaxID=3154727 RepID=UPI00342000A5